MIAVWLVRSVRVFDHSGTFRRGVLLPFVPRVGDGFVLSKWLDPEEVTEVFVNGVGVPVVRVDDFIDEKDGYEPNDDALVEDPNGDTHFAYATKGWERDDKLRYYREPVPPDAKPYSIPG